MHMVNKHEMHLTLTWIISYAKVGYVSYSQAKQAGNAVNFNTDYFSC